MLTGPKSERFWIDELESILGEGPESSISPVVDVRLVELGPKVEIGKPHGFSGECDCPFREGDRGSCHLGLGEDIVCDPEFAGCAGQRPGPDCPGPGTYTLTKEVRWELEAAALRARAEREMVSAAWLRKPSLSV